MIQELDYFYLLDGGRDQPNCVNPASTNCAHSAAVYYYLNSYDATKCRFPGFPCSNYSDFESGLCSKQCNGDSCNYMGHASKNGNTDNLYLTTPDASCYTSSIQFNIPPATNSTILPQNTVVYPVYGTFTNSSPYSDPEFRPVAELPQDPSFINTRFFLFTRKNSKMATQITSNSDNSIFVKNDKMIFYIHGFNTNSSADWVIELKDAVLSEDDTNFVAVDWSGGARGTYEQGIANIQIAGIDVALLINSFVDKKIVTSNGVQIIGHSLGAHAASYVGKRVNVKVGRITGLDPSGRQFEGMSTQVRLNSNDASFVDIIHTNAGGTGAGILSPSGHVDFWPSKSFYFTF